jgi:hypothetical protein
MRPAAQITCSCCIRGRRSALVYIQPIFAAAWLPLRNLGWPQESPPRPRHKQLPAIAPSVETVCSMSFSLRYASYESPRCRLIKAPKQYDVRLITQYSHGGKEWRNCLGVICFFLLFYKTEIGRERRNLVCRQLAGNMRHRMRGGPIVAFAPLLESILQVAV